MLIVSHFCVFADEGNTSEKFKYSCNSFWIEKICLIFFSLSVIGQFMLLLGLSNEIHMHHPMVYSPAVQMNKLATKFICKSAKYSVMPRNPPAGWLDQRTDNTLAVMAGGCFAVAGVCE